AAATAAAGAMVALVQTSANSARELRAQAQVANASTQELQRLAFGAARVGIEQEKLSDIFKDTNDRIGDFLRTGAGEFVDFFEQIAPKVGLTAEELARMSGPQALQAVFNALERTNMSAAETIFFMEALSSESSRLIPLLRDGGRGFQEAAAQAEELGIILSDLDLARLQDFSEQSQQITTALTGMKNVIAVELAPVLAEIGERFFEAAVSGDGFRQTVRDSIESSIRVVGFFLDAVEGVKRAFVVAGSAVAVFALEVGKNMSEAAAFILEGPVNAVNLLIKDINRLLPKFAELENVEQPDFARDMRAQVEMLERSIAIGRQDIEDTLLAPMPSAAIEEFLNEVDERVANFRDNFQQEGGLFGRQMEGTSPQGQGQGGAGDDEDDAGRFLGGVGIFGEGESGAFIDLLRARLEARQDVLREFDALDTERQQEKFEADLERLREALKLRAITEDEYRRAALEREREFAAEKFGIRQDGESGITGLVDRFNNQQVSMYGTAFDSILASLSQYSETAFNIQKGLAIANATVNAYEAITGAYKWGANIGGPPLGAAMAAAAGAAQFAQIRAISAQQFSASGASGVGGGGARAVAGGGGGSAAASAQAAQEEPRENQIVTINLQGGDMFSGRQVRQLIQEINDAVSDGAKIRVN
ncbi:MAG: hypothetical protein R3221_06880, partial [Spongiibacter sp.]|nr:hypothetical protein [Spongiibacter sp.]